MPSLTETLSKTSHLMFTPDPILPSSTRSPILIKTGDRIVILRPIECWFEGATVIASGLEVRGTSCHNVEAVALEEILEGGGKGRGVNAHWDHLVEPLGFIEFGTYSDSTVAVTGVLDHPDSLNQFPKLLLKCLIYVLKKKVGADRVLRATDLSVDDEQTIINCATVLAVCALSSPDLTVPSLSSLWKIYKGELADTTPGELRHYVAGKGELRDVLMVAVRFAVKVLWDCVAGGEEVDALSDREVKRILDDFWNNWHITVHEGQGVLKHNSQVTSQSLPSDAPWFDAVTAETPSIFSLGIVKASDEVTSPTQNNRRTGRGSATSRSAHSLKLTARTLQRNEREKGYIGKLCWESLRSIWANLTFELLYLTHDDDGNEKKKTNTTPPFILSKPHI
ncbi:Pecanex-like protein 4 [Dinochytrium kinnereticum]|nr:Pecanex-like protein 4 [Dinochytrium kinnereticum]